MKKKIGLLLLLLCPLFVAAQGVVGAWEGTLNAGADKIRVVFRIVQAGDAYAVTMDSPDQGLRGFPVASAEFRNPELTLDMPQFKAGYKGVLNAGAIVGVFSQNGYDMPLVLTRKTQEEVVHRPQEPQPPYPYRSVEVSVPDPKAGLTLKGTLTLPEAPGRYPAVILLTGSGCQNRDEELFGHKPFLVLADCLTRCGVAVLRCDDRGWNESPERRKAFADSTADDLADDALAAFEFLKTQPEIDPARIGMLGHSEGAAVALIAAARNSDVAFVASLAGVAVKGRRVLVAQNRALLALAGLPEALADEYSRVLDSLFGVIETTPAAEIAARRSEIADSLIAPASSLPEPLRENLTKLLEVADDHLRFMLTYDPAADIAALGVRPLLAIGGTKDCQVDAAMNLEAFRALRPAAAHPDDLIRSFEGLNHLFQPCTTGNVAEYGQIETTIAPEVLEAVAAWVGKR